MSNMNELQTQSESLIDLAESLALAIQVRDGSAKTPLMSANQAACLVNITRQEILSRIQDRDRSLDRYEQEVKEEEARKIAQAEKTRIMQGIVGKLPVDWDATVSGSTIKTTIGATLELCNIYASSRSWRNDRVIGKRIEVSCNFETRRFPQKKDGTFSVEKIVASVTDLAEARSAKEARYNRDKAIQAEFQRIVQPFDNWTVYGTDKEWTKSETSRLKTWALGNGKYAVSRTVTEYVDGAQLTAILENEIGRAKKEEA